MTRNLILILGDQLNFDNPALEGFDSAQDCILMVEASGESTHVWSHKARIVLFLSAMRHYVQAMNEQGLSITYLKLGEHDFASLKSAWQHYIVQLKPKKIIVCEPGEYRLEQDLIYLARETNTQLAIKDDLHFMCSRADFKGWAANGKQLRMEFFYRMMRKKYNVLMQSDQPEGGAWNYDAENRKAFGKTGPKDLQASLKVSIDEITQQVIDTVEQYFPTHLGSLANFIWPVTRAQALLFLEDFITNKLAGFGDHQDAMWQAISSCEAPYLWHSLLSTSLNLKLLDPREVIEAAVDAYRKKQLPLPSVEGFIRQILGWREFIRGVYWLDMPQMAESNHYQHTRKLPDWYWTGDTQMNCQRQTIMQTMQYGYAHHIQRLMITGMFGVLAELNPREVEAWYLAVYVDAVEWVELPNVAGMALYANGGRFTSKPYVASGAYIKRMSNYCAGCKYKPEVKTGADACPVTTLYWHFLIKHYEEFSRNPRTALMTKNVDRFNPEELAAIQYSAEKVLNNLNLL
ncbi:MAG: cryptochrome/photolyase family protein [Bacteroidia bacterium]|nr:cryptochrome/photolyase family protein [Methylotenera sp.]